MNKTDKIIARIKKCLELSKSPNPNEASVALRQAKAMMAKYNITLSEIEQLSIFSAKVTSTRKSPMKYERYLHSAMAKAFVCTIILEKDTEGKANFVYYGREADVRVATYMYEVLLRALQESRREFRKAYAGDKNLNNLTNSFCEGWTSAVYVTASELREASTEKEMESKVESAVDEYMQSIYGGLRTVKARKRKISQAEFNAYTQGVKVGEKQSLHLGIH